MLRPDHLSVAPTHSSRLSLPVWVMRRLAARAILNEKEPDMTKNLLVELSDSLAEAAERAGQRQLALLRGDTQCQALFAQQGVTAITTAIRNDQPFFGEMGDVFYCGVTGPFYILLAWLQWCTQCVQTFYKVVG